MAKEKKETKTTKKKAKVFGKVYGARKEKTYLMENLSMLLASGMGVTNSLEAIQEEIRTKKLREIIQEINNQIRAGSTVWKALQEAKLFPDHVVSLVRLGEQSGKLAKNLRVIVDEQEKNRLFRSRIQSGMLYPAFVFGMAVIVGTVIAWFILPRLATLFTSLDVDLPLITRVLIKAGEILQVWGIIIIPVFIGVFGLITYFIFFYPKTKYIGQGILFSFPGVRGLMQEISLSRQGYVLGTLLNAGLPIVESLTALEQTATIERYRRWYIIMKEKIEAGYSFDNIFTKYPKIKKDIPLPIQQMIISGEQSGNLPETFMKIGEIYEVKTETTTKNITVILEPILLVIVWVGVVIVALSVIMPIYGLIGGLGERTEETRSTPEASVVTDDAQEAELTSTPEPTITLTPTPSPTPADEEETTTPEANILGTVEVLESPTGSVNIRDASSTAGEIVETAEEGQQYPYVSQKGGWYEIIIDLSDDEYETGWIIETYVDVLSETEPDATE